MQNTDEVRKAGISLGLSHLLDCVGYSPQMINLRRRLYMNFDYIANNIYYHNNRICSQRTVGSKGEGGSRIYESDYDTLVFFKNVVCIETSVLNYTESILKDHKVYTMVPCLYHPGHFKLLLTRESFPSLFTDSLCTCLNPSDSGQWLSSKEFIRMVKNENAEEADTTAGPAVCVTNRKDVADMDTTFTFPCSCPTILGNWIQRERKYNWPPKEVIQQISQMTGNLVATGIKGCHEEEIEWRLCFNEIELLLVENLNETHTKLYIFLKMIKKDILKLDHEITSYIMKNIVFWLSETYPQNDFRPDNFFSWVMKALRLLKRAVKKFKLPYFLIPERNLIAEKIPKYRIKDVIRQINDAIKLGPQLLWKCKKIDMAMAMSLPELQLYKQKTDELEWLAILHQLDKGLKCDCLGLTRSDWEKTDFYTAIAKRIGEIVCSSWPPVVQRQLIKCTTYGDVYRLLLK